MIAQINDIYPVLPGAKAHAPKPATAQVQGEGLQKQPAQAEDDLIDLGDTPSSATTMKPPPGAARPSMEAIERQDTETGERDEFVDAEG